MSASNRYLDALDEMDGAEEIGLRAVVEAFADGDRETAVELLRTLVAATEDNIDE